MWQPKEITCYTMATISLSGLTKHYNEGGIVAVEDVNLEVIEGEFLVLVGPSGSGKSTILRMIAGLEDVTSGEVKIDGEFVNDRKPRERDIAMVFQDYALYPNMTVQKNLGFGLKMSTSLSKSERRDAIEKTAQTVDIMDLLGKRPTQLSGGEKQRVALGRAIVRDPSVFLMDEPLSNLDAKLRRAMRTEIEALQAELGTTTVYVTHNQTEAMTMGDRIVILNKGQIQQTGTPLECYFRPRNLFVAGFIGDPPMNFFDGTVEGGTFRCQSFDYDLGSKTRSDLDGHDAVTIGIRPEDIELAQEPVDAQYIECTVGVVEEMGAIQHVHLKTNNNNEELIVVTHGTEVITEKDQYAAVVPQEHIHAFDQETGTALHSCALRDDRKEKLTRGSQSATIT
jgi:multiple sugar transport system ATP-binding protein